MNLSHCISFLVIILFTLFPLPIARDTITPTQPLLDGEILTSTGIRFALGFFTPSKSNKKYIGIWYNTVPVQTIVWVANRNDPIANSTTATLAITSNGSLTIIDDRNSAIVWSTAATSLANPVAQLLDTGNFVVKEEGSATSDTASFPWQGFDYPTDTQLPGMKIGVDLTTGLNRTITSWKGNSDLSLGKYRLAVDIAGAPQLILWAGTTKVWRTSPWVGDWNSFTYNFVNNKQEVTSSYHATNQSTLSRLVVNQSGVIQLATWLEEAGQWSLLYSVPSDMCDRINACGPYSVCDSSSSPMCSCLHGFQPKNPARWALRDATDGCIRNTTLNCDAGTDGFVAVNNLKLPDTSKSLLHTSLTLWECHNLCSRNCACTAYARPDTSESGIGCIIWTTDLTDMRGYTNIGASQNFYIRLAGSELGLPLDAHSHRSTSFAIWVTIVVVIVVLGSFSSLAFYLRRRKKMKTGHDGIQRDDDLELPLFDFKSIAAATNNFSITNKLGEGGFGPVYKGKLGHDQDIAVKRLAKTSRQGSDEFKTEVMLIAKLQHRNLVRLLGCCIQGDERMLIYEYMPNKSLDAFLFEKERAALLDWKTRYHIILGIARGLVYLHRDSRFRIIHRDLKANNILLDKEMNPKISDFGLARISREDESEINTRKIVGTYGYMSPEYAMDGIFSVKSDVYSFGVLVLEIISGKKNRGAYAFSLDTNLVIHMWNLWNDGNVIELVDESLGNYFPVAEVLRCIKVGLLCVQERPEYRPFMSEVIKMLNNDSAPMVEPKEPGFFVRRGPAEVHSSSSKQPSSNGLTITMSSAGR